MGNNISYVFTCQILDCEVTKLLRRSKVAAAVIYAAMNQHLVSSVWAFMDPGPPSYGSEGYSKPSLYGGNIGLQHSISCIGSILPDAKFHVCIQLLVVICLCLPSVDRTHGCQTSFVGDFSGASPELFKN